MAEKLQFFEQKKEGWRQHSKQIEAYFQTQLEQIRGNFDQQLRELVEKHHYELQIMEQAIQQKQLKVDEQSAELVTLKTGITQNKFLELKAEVMSNTLSESSQVFSAAIIDKQQRSSFNTLQNVSGVRDSSNTYNNNHQLQQQHQYQDTIERLKDRVNQL